MPLHDGTVDERDMGLWKVILKVNIKRDENVKSIC